MTTHVSNIYLANRALSRSITSDAIESGNVTSFPFYSIPYFEVYANNARKHGFIPFITYAPVCRKEQLERYVDFVASPTASDWLEQSRIIYDAQEFGSKRQIESSYDMTPKGIYNIEWIATSNSSTSSSEKGQQIQVVPIRSDKDFILPTLHHSPPPQKNCTLPYMNLNMLSLVPDFETSVMAAFTLQDLVFSKTEPYFFGQILTEYIGVQQHERLHELGQGEDHDEENEHSLVSHNSDRHDDQIAIEPHFMTIQPVFSSLDERGGHDDTNTNKEILGFIFSIMSWDTFLTGLLPVAVGGIYVVVKNSCEQVATYELHGTKVSSFFAQKY
jgi:hypothetical protein